MPLGLPAPASVGRYERRRDGSVSQRDAGVLVWSAAIETTIRA
jgi:hypothetical protein